MHHPVTNAELARLAHAQALRRVDTAPRPPDEAPQEGNPAPWAIARLAARLLPELPVSLPWPEPPRRTSGPLPA